jgi:hypothetical protein
MTIEYHWEELWRSIMALFDFISARLDSLKVLGRLDELVEEVRAGYTLTCCLLKRGSADAHYT